MIRGLAHAKATINFGNDKSLDENEEDSAAGDGGMGVWGVVPKGGVPLRIHGHAPRGRLLAS